MNKTLRISFSLKNTYRVNGILYSLKQIPLIRKVIPAGVYGVRGFKVFANVLSWISEVFSVFVWKFIYFLVMITGTMTLYGVAKETEPALFLHIFLFLTLMGAYINCVMFNPTKDKYYALILLRMNAREYTLVNYFYTIIKVLAGFLLCGIVFGSKAGLSVWECMLIPCCVAGLKLSYAAIELKCYEKRRGAKSENKLKRFDWVFLLLLLLIAYGLPVLGVMIPREGSVVLMGVSVVAGLLSLHKIITFKFYRPMYQELLTEAVNMMDPSAVQEIQRVMEQKKISVDTDIGSTKKGFEYLNELFIKRHQKILWKSAKKISVVVLALIVGVLILFFAVPGTKEVTNRLILSFLPYFVFVMYILNRGTGFTRALFVNCDHSLLTYPFYKEPKQILKLFRIRLWEIIKVNLLPASVIGSGLVLLLLVSGGTDNPLNYAILLVAVVCMSVFFSVHYLTLYYLLQPYNAGSEMKSGTYQILMMVTYLVCYVMIKIKLPIFGFGLSAIVFCVLYCILACFLVYKFAPKTFKLR